MSSTQGTAQPFENSVGTIQECLVLMWCEHHVAVFACNCCRASWQDWPSPDLGHVYWRRRLGWQLANGSTHDDRNMTTYPNADRDPAGSTQEAIAQVPCGTQAVASCVNPAGCLSAFGSDKASNVALHKHPFLFPPVPSAC